ncbi:TetR/AcrR family transcriptional regulator [Acinetobacter ursingii]|uniref:TetR/AcrR family transcriptional regulator n=1 Tax=Acinetobacter ursingii TaxID=108980 RepID=UPI00300B09C1
MSSVSKAVSRGRPRSITPERITTAGIEIGLSNITFVGVAAALGVSHMALYKHVSSIEELKYMIAEEIFNRWQIPEPQVNEDNELKDYLIKFTLSLQQLIKSNVGLTPYIIRRVATPASVMQKIHQHHQTIAQFYGLPIEKARWLNATVAFHCIAVADTIYSVAGKEPVTQTDRVIEEAEMEAEFNQSMYALIIGALALVKDENI